MFSNNVSLNAAIKASGGHKLICTVNVALSIVYILYRLIWSAKARGSSTLLNMFAVFVVLMRVECVCAGAGACVRKDNLLIIRDIYRENESLSVRCSKRNLCETKSIRKLNGF